MSKFIYRAWGCLLFLVFLFVAFPPSIILGVLEFIILGKHTVIGEMLDIFDYIINVLDPE